MGIWVLAAFDFYKYSVSKGYEVPSDELNTL